MQFYKFFVFVAVLVACALAVHGYPSQFQPTQEQRVALPEEAAGGAGQSAAGGDLKRSKKFAIISPYSAIPAAYTAFPYSSYSSFSYIPTASYPSFYSSPYFF